jgi:hypothetical protein
MNRKQWLFFISLLVYAAHAFGQGCISGSEAVVGWDPVEYPPPDTPMYAVMIFGPLFGVITGALRVIARRTGGEQPELIMVRFR